jgi:hypothetical protein
MGVAMPRASEHDIGVQHPFGRLQQAMIWFPFGTGLGSVTPVDPQPTSSHPAMKSSRSFFTQTSSTRPAAA